LRISEQEENKARSLLNELRIEEESPKVKNFDRHKNLEQLHAKFKK